MKSERKNERCRLYEQFLVLINKEVIHQVLLRSLVTGKPNY